MKLIHRHYSITKCVYSWQKKTVTKKIKIKIWHWNGGWSYYYYYYYNNICIITLQDTGFYLNMFEQPSILKIILSPVLARNFKTNLSLNPITSTVSFRILFNLETWNSVQFCIFRPNNGKKYRKWQKKKKRWKNLWRQSLLCIGYCSNSVHFDFRTRFQNELYTVEDRL
jgi:hypothetical protein